MPYVYVDVDIDDVLEDMSTEAKKDLLKTLQEEFAKEVEQNINAPLIEELHQIYTNYGLEEMLKHIQDIGYKYGTYFNFKV